MLTDSVVLKITGMKNPGMLEEMQAIWVELIAEMFPKEEKTGLDDLIAVNSQAKMKEILQSIATEVLYLSVNKLERFMSKGAEAWTSIESQSHQNQLVVMKSILAFRKRQHLEMLDLTEFRRIIDSPRLVTVFSKEFFVNFTVQENAANHLLYLQGLYIKCFIYFRLRHDMRFRASIDSFMIELDNPFTRHAIREENSHDVYFSKKYLSNEFNIQKFCISILERFFPNISGIWAQSGHMTPAYILQFIRIAFEYGFIDAEHAKDILKLLVKAANSLSKMEEAYGERYLYAEKSFTQKMRLSDVVNLLTKCREHLAMILIEIYTLLNDNLFVDLFPKYCLIKGKTEAETRQKIEQTISEDMKEKFILFDPQINDAFLSITLSYLNKHFELCGMPATSEFCKSAVEKIFMTLTTTQKDVFLNSLKQITVKDLGFMDTKLKKSNSAWEFAENYGYALRKLIDFVSRGFFHKDTGKCSVPNSDPAKDELYDKYLSKYLTAPSKKHAESTGALDKPDYPTLHGALKKIVQDIRELINSRPESKVSLVKESIPLLLVTLPDYCVDYFHEDIYKVLADECFTLLGEITMGNNFAKAQIFKGESLFHFRKLLQKFDRDAFGFLFKLCNEQNASIFMGRDVFATFLRLFIRLDNSVFERLRPERHEKDKDLMIAEHLEKCISLLLLVRFFAKLFDKPFLDETEKLQNILLTQETIFDAFYEYFLPKLMSYVDARGYDDLPADFTTPDCRLKQDLFQDGKEEELLLSLTQITASQNATETELDMLKVQMGFEFLKLYNRLTTDCISRLHQKKLSELFKDRSLPDFVAGNGLLRNYWLFPESLEAEFIDLARIVAVFPEQNTMIEKMADFDTGILEIANAGAKKELNSKMMLLNNRLAAEKEVVEPEIKDLKLQIKQLAYRELETISKFMMSAESLKSHAHPGKKPEILLMKGVLPLVYAYLTTLRNQSLMNNSKNVRIAFTRVTTVLNMLLYSKETIEQFCKKTFGLSKDVIEKLGFTSSLLKGFEIPWEKARNTDGLIPNILKQLEVGEAVATGLQDIVKPTSKADDSQDVTKMESVYWSVCHYLIEQIEKYFEGTEYHNIIKLKKDISASDLKVLMYAAKFEEVTTDPELILKKEVLNIFIREFQEAKDQYLTREEEPNLLKFFERDTQILQGVFISCKQKLVGHSKLETRSRSVLLCDSKEIAKFWVNGSSIGLVTLIGMLIERSTTARGELYDFICASEEQEEDEKGGSEDGEDKAEEFNEHAELNSHQSEAYHQAQLENHKTEQDEVILSTLIRIQTDLVFYLNSCSQRNMVWWVVHRVYEMICLFFKNLCECNFMQFKEFLGNTVPSIRDSEWRSDYRNFNYTRIFSEQMKYIMKTTQISINQEPYLIPSDYPDRVQDVFMPLAQIVNEVVIGPCEVNQNIIIDTDLTGVCSLATRLMDNTEDKFYDVANICLELVLTLTEGFKEPILKKIASKLPPSIIKDRICRLIKKLYVQHQIREGDFKFKDVKEEEQAPTSIARNQVMPVRKIKTQGSIVEKKPDTIVTEKMEETAKIEDWQDLFDLYMAEKEFSDSPLFEFAFKLLVLWFTLARCSKSHNNQLEEIKRTSSEFFKEETFGKGLKFLGVNKLVGGAGQLMKFLSDVPKPSDFDSIFHFLTKKIVCSVEVLDNKGEGIILTFPKKPECFMLSDEAKKNYRNECDISDSNTKMGDLLRNFDLFVIQMESSFRTSKLLGKLYELISTDAFWYYTLGCYAIAFALNIVLAVSTIRATDADGNYFGPFIYSSTSYENAINVLSLILIVMSALMLVLWFITKYKSTYETRREDYKFDNPGKNPNRVTAVLYIAIVESFLKQNFPVSYTLHLLFTVLGYFSLDIFYSFNLLCIINISNTTKFVLKSIMLHIDQLALTFILAMFVIYLYTIMVVTYFHDTLKFDDGSTNQICDEMYLCYFYVLNLGFRNGGGFAESLSDISTRDRFAGRTFFDLSFFMLINVISLKVIFGIIIDTFSQLRDDQNERTNDMENNCFVCGNTRMEFGKKNENFNKHIKSVHDPWRYVFYIYYLKDKGESELSGIEYEAWMGFVQKETDWLPIGKTITLKNDEEEQFTFLEKRIDKLDVKLAEVCANSAIAKKNFRKIKKYAEEHLNVNVGGTHQELLSPAKSSPVGRSKRMLNV